MYPLKACQTCIHNQVCGLMKEYEKFQNSYPIDISEADCDHYLEGMEHDVETGENNHISSLIDMIEHLESNGVKTIMIAVNSNTYDELFGDAGYNTMLYNGRSIPIRINDELPDYMWDLAYREGGN